MISFHFVKLREQQHFSDVVIPEQLDSCGPSCLLCQDTYTGNQAVEFYFFDDGMQELINRPS